jgi:hypothetical protein
MGDQTLAIGLEKEPLVVALEQLGAKQLIETAACVRLSSAAALVALPVSTTATKARNREMSMSRRRLHL